MATRRKLQCSRRRDGCAVETQALAPLIRAFVEQHERDHPELALEREYATPESRRSARRRLAGAGGLPLSGVAVLTERTARVDPAGQGVSERTINRVLTGRSRFTELRTADALLAAAGQEHAFYDGRVQVVPNPAAAPQDRAECCGGSLNGSLGP